MKPNSIPPRWAKCATCGCRRKQELKHLPCLPPQIPQLCTHMAPDYHQLEFDLRLYLTHLDQRAGPRSSSSQGAVAAADTAEAAGSASGALAAAGAASMPIRAT